MKKVIVVHPGKQHSYHLAEALKKEGMLLYYVTTVYNKKNSWTNFLGLFLKGDNKKRFLTRKSEVFDNNVIQFCELKGLILLFLYRKKPNWIWTQKLEKNIHEKVYLKTIKLAAKSNVDAVIFYGGLKEKHFDLKQKVCPDIKFIVDVPSATDQFVYQFLKNDVEVTGDEYIKIEQATTWNAGKKAIVPVRNLLADGFLVGSSFVERSLTAFRADEKKIKIVPYGVDVSRFSPKDSGSLSEIIKFIFVGRVNRRKGIQHLLPAFTKIDDKKAELLVVGQYDPEDKLIKQYSDRSNIKFIGFVTQDKVADLYKEADVFILPSLGEGMSQVTIEAMSSGLPVIVSENAGVNDIISEKKDGIIVPVSDENALYEAMQWYVDNREKIEIMGKYAISTAQTYTWDYYEKNVVKAVQELVGE